MATRYRQAPRVASDRSPAGANGRGEAWPRSSTSTINPAPRFCVLFSRSLSGVHVCGVLDTPRGRGAQPPKKKSHARTWFTSQMEIASSSCTCTGARRAGLLHGRRGDLVRAPPDRGAQPPMKVLHADGAGSQSRREIGHRCRAVARLHGHISRGRDHMSWLLHDCCRPVLIHGTNEHHKRTL